jgi:hypothetical protein
MTNTKYKDLKAGAEFTLPRNPVFGGNKVVFIKNDWLSAQVKGKKKYLSIQPSVEVQVIKA